MAGRPKKGSNPRKVELSAEQKRYAAIIKEAEELTELKQKRIDALSEKIKDLKEEQTTLQNEVNNLRGIRTSAENILASKPAPPEWQKFTEYVHHYHHYYYPNVPVYFGPWWYYTNGGTLTYPTWQTITNPVYSGNYAICNTVSGNVNLTNAQTGNFTLTSTAGSLPNSLTVNSSNLSLASSSFNVNATADLSGLSGPTVFSSITSSGTAASTTSSYVMPSLTEGITYVPTSEQVTQSEQFLKSINFFGEGSCGTE